MLKTHNSLVRSKIAGKVGVIKDKDGFVAAYDSDSNDDDSTVAKVQVMITHKMKKTLMDDLGYLPDEVWLTSSTESNKLPLILYMHLI